ncbi:MAG: 50S ribosomal protein L9 [Thermodesulfobacteriota bacterium]|nr:50S ribosomal protein L9 [Thermodesulfobacteriota bacterium]
MKIVLIETIDGLGTAGQEIRVKDGYARNYLLPKGKALLAKDSMIKAFKDKISSHIRVEQDNKDHAIKLAEELAKISLGFEVRSGQEGKLFGSITSANIHDALVEKGFEIDRKKVVLSDPIRHVGTHEVFIRLYPEVVAGVKVEVTPLVAE